MADLLPLRVHSFGNIELLTRTPLAMKAGLGGDLLNFVICVILFGVVTYFVANFMIKNSILLHQGVMVIMIVTVTIAMGMENKRQSSWHVRPTNHQNHSLIRRER